MGLSLPVSLREFSSIWDVLKADLVPIPMVTFLGYKVDSHKHKLYNLWKAGCDVSDLYIRSQDEDVIKIVLSVDNQGSITDIGRHALGFLDEKHYDYTVNSYVLPDGEYENIQGEGVFEIRLKSIRDEIGTWYPTYNFAHDALQDPVFGTLLRHPNFVSDRFSLEPGQTHGRLCHIAKKTKSYHSSFSYRFPDVGPNTINSFDVSNHPPFTLNQFQSGRWLGIKKEDFNKTLEELAR